MYPPQPPPLARIKSATSLNKLPKHEPPPIEEFRDLIGLYQRRRNEIALDRNVPDDASLQALSIVVHAYKARYRCATAEAAAVLRPMTIGAMG